MPIERQQPYKAIRAKTINAGVEAREMWDQLQVAAPLEMSKGPTGVLLRLAMSVPGAQVAQAGASGIAGRSGTTLGSDTVTLQKIDGDTISATTVTYTAFNLSSHAVGANDYVITIRVGRSDLVIWDDCP